MSIRTKMLATVVAASLAASGISWAYTLELASPGDNVYMKGMLTNGKSTAPVFNVPPFSMVAKIAPVPDYYGQQHPVFHYRYVPTGDENTISMNWSMNNPDGSASYVAASPWPITARRREYNCYATWSGLTSTYHLVHIAKGRQADEIAAQWIGSPYHLGGKGPSYCPGSPTHGAPDYCFDCSGLIWWCYSRLGVTDTGFNKNAQWFHDNRTSTPTDPIKGEYITFGTNCTINHVAMQSDTGTGTGTIEATGTQVQRSSYNANNVDHYGSLFYPEEKPSGD